MHGLNLLTPRQIHNRARELQDAMVSPHRQVKLTHPRPHQALAIDDGYKDIAPTNNYPPQPLAFATQAQSG